MLCTCGREARLAAAGGDVAEEQFYRAEHARVRKLIEEELATLR